MTSRERAQASSPPRPDLTGLVLCGGRSRRMGRDKAVLAIGGATLVERAAAVLSSVASRTLLACGTTPRYGELGLEIALDPVEDGGPLAGLAAGLAAATTEWTAVLACDMPRAEARVLALLHDRARERDLDVCLLETRSGLEPLCAVYRQSCLAPVRDALARGERKMTAFHARLRAGTLREDELPADLKAAGVAANLNTPQDLSAESAGRRSA